MDQSSIILGEPTWPQISLLVQLLCDHWQTSLHQQSLHCTCMYTLKQQINRRLSLPHSAVIDFRSYAKLPDPPALSTLTAMAVAFLASP